jgi:hypothetical protein
MSNTKPVAVFFVVAAVALGLVLLFFICRRSCCRRGASYHAVNHGEALNTSYTL